MEMRKADVSLIGHRSLTDEHGRTWHIWEVHPTPTDRRLIERRAESAQVARDQRKKADRRAVTDRRAMIDPELAFGWLAFQCDDERRRFAPIPENWTQLSGRELLRLLHQARPVVPVTTAERTVSPPTPSVFGPPTSSPKKR